MICCEVKCTNLVVGSALRRWPGEMCGFDVFELICVDLVSDLLCDVGQDCFVAEL